MNGLDKLQRSVVNKNGFFLLSTEPSEGATYAFYLRHKKGTEKVFYKPKTECLFDIAVEPGHYVATFFYQKNKERKAFREEVVVTKTGEVIKNNVRLLGEEEGWKINYYENGSEVTFIVFNGAGSTKNASPFGLNYLLSKGYNVVACLQNNDQYQSLSFEDFKKCVSTVVKGKRTFLYGSSLGGYCAVYYAGAVNGTVIAAAPRNSAHPRVISNTKKSPFEAKNFMHNDIHENPLTKKNVYVLIDPYVRNDVFFMSEFVKPAYPNLKELHSPHAGHEVLFHINKTRQLDGIVTSIVEERSNISIDSSIDSCYTYRGKAAHFLAKKDYKNAVEFSKKSLMDKTMSEKIRQRTQRIHNQAIEMLNR